MYGPGDRNLTDTVTYWAPTDELNVYNEPAYAAPVLIKGKWKDLTNEKQAAFSEVIQATTEVVVSQAVDEKGYLAKGDYTTEPNPHNVEGAMEIQGFKSSPDLRSMSQQKKAYL